LGKSEHYKIGNIDAAHLMRGSNLKPHPHHLCNAARIVTVRLVDLRRQHSPHMSRLNINHWQARFGEAVGAVSGLTLQVSIGREQSHR
jgi:hypothetical protein